MKVKVNNVPCWVYRSATIIIPDGTNIDNDEALMDAINRAICKGDLELDTDQVLALS